MLICIGMNKTKYTEEYLKDKKYNSLTFVSLLPKKEKGKNDTALWQCDCGSIIEANISCVVLGKKMSCTCYKNRRRENHYLWKGIGDLPGRYWWMLCFNAKTRNIEIKITQQEAWDQFLKQNGRCALSGVYLTFETKTGEHDGTASLDRIDSSKPYETGNIQWVHKDINEMKKGLNEPSFLDWCKKITDNQVLKK